MANNEPDSPVNDQLADAAHQTNAAVLSAAEATARAMAQQTMAHAIGLAMQNAVHQQQQLYILRNAATTAASRAILKSDPLKALELAQSLYNSDDITKTLAGFKDLMAQVAPPDKQRPPAPREAVTPPSVTTVQANERATEKVGKKATKKKAGNKSG